MGLQRDDQTGHWRITKGSEDYEKIAKRSHQSYLDTLPKYLNCFEPAFTAAKERSEFNFLCTILPVTPSSAPGWDPFETTLETIPKVLELIEQNQQNIVSEHLLLWSYCHIVEASEPYELLHNIVSVATGQRHNIRNFPDKTRSRDQRNIPQTVGEKIQKLQNITTNTSFQQIVTPIAECYDRELRNCIQHSDYSFFGSELRTKNPARKYSHDEKLIKVNKALAYLEAVRIMRAFHISSYSEPKQIPCGKDFSDIPNEMATVIIQKGYGAVGLKHSWTKDQIKNGRIAWHVARLNSQEDSELLRNDPELAILPERNEPGQQL